MSVCVCWRYVKVMTRHTTRLLEVDLSLFRAELHVAPTGEAAAAASMRQRIFSLADHALSTKANNNNHHSSKGALAPYELRTANERGAAAARQ